MKVKLNSRILVTLLSLLFILALAAGCQATGGKETASPAGTGTQKPVDEPSASPIPTATITFLCQDYYFQAYPVTELGDYPSGQKLLEDMAALGLNLEFETVAPEQLEMTIKTRMAAGGNLPDVIAGMGLIDDATAVQWGKDGLVLDIQEAVDQYDEDGSIFALWDRYWPHAKGMITADDGGIYWFPSLNTVFNIVDGSGFVHKGTGFTSSIRKDWLDALHIEYKQTMTTQELADALVAFRAQDANQNGVEDEVFAANIEGFIGSVPQGFGLVTDLARFVTGNDEVQCPWYQPGIRDYITYMKQLVELGVYDSALLGEGVYTQMMTENRIGVTSANYICATWDEPATGAADAEYAPIMVDAGLDYVEPVLWREWNNIVSGKWFVTSGCENVEAVIRLFDYVYTYDMYVLDMFGIEDLSFTKDSLGIMSVTFDRGTAVATKTQEVGLCYLLVGNALPPIRFGDTSKEASINQTTYDSKNSMEEYIQSWEYLEDNNGQPLAMITDEEAEVINRLGTVIKTYSNELLVDLIMGNKSLDDLDTYIQEMKGIGLDEYLGVFQSRYDRYKSNLSE